MNYTDCFQNVLRLYPSLRQARAHCGMVTTAVAARHESKGCPTVYQVYLGGNRNPHCQCPFLSFST